MKYTQFGMQQTNICNVGNVQHAPQLRHRHIFVMQFVSLLIFALFYACAAIEQVLVELYYETQCGDCQVFTRKSLRPALESLSAHIKLSLIPYGNAKKVGDDSYECQHGPDECLGNLWAGCVWNKMQEPARMATVYCMEEWGSDFNNLVPDCMKRANATNADQVTECAKGSEGAQIQSDNAARTDALNPPHTYVPWVLINGNHTEDLQTRAENNLTALVCDLLQTKPSQCTSTA
jgi:interferon gamma-inducible protein 30